MCGACADCGSVVMVMTAASCDKVQTDAQQRIARGLAHHFATGSSLVGPGTVEPYRSSRTRPQVWVCETEEVVCACVRACVGRQYKRNSPLEQN